MTTDINIETGFICVEECANNCVLSCLTVDNRRIAVEKFLESIKEGQPQRQEYWERSEQQEKFVHFFGTRSVAPLV